jgi:hypothetical protein
MWKKLQKHFASSPVEVRKVIHHGLLDALLVFAASDEMSVRSSAADMLRDLTVRCCFADTALLLVRSGAVEAVCSLSKSVGSGGEKRGSSATGLSFIADGMEVSKAMEQVEREIRNSCLAFLSNISRYAVVSKRIVLRGGLSCVVNCIRWDRYSSRNRHESDLLHLVALGIIKRCLHASTDDVRASCLKKTGLHDRNGMETLQFILSKMMERTHETIMLRIMPSFTQMTTTIEIRQYIIQILMDISRDKEEGEEEGEEEKQQEKQEEKQEEKETDDEDYEEKNGANNQEEEEEEEQQIEKDTDEEVVSSTTTRIAASSSSDQPRQRESRDILAIDEVASMMLDSLHARMLLEIDRLKSRLPTMPTWSEEERKGISKKKQKTITEQARRELGSKTSIALRAMVSKLEHVVLLGNQLRDRLRPVTIMTMEEAAETRRQLRDMQLKEWTNDLKKSIARLVELWFVHFACNATTAKEGGQRLCDLLDMMLVPTTPQSREKAEREKEEGEWSIFEALEQSLPILRHCWEHNTLRTEQIASCYCRALFVLTGGRRREQEQQEEEKEQQQQQQQQKSKRKRKKKTIEEERSEAYLTRCVRREDLIIAKDIARLAGSRASKRWYHLSSSLCAMTSVVHLRRSLLQFNVTPLILCLVQQADEDLVKHHALNDNQDLAVVGQEQQQGEEAADEADKAALSSSDKAALSSADVPTWERSMLCRRSCECLAYTLYDLSISCRTRKWLVGKGMLMSLRRMTGSKHSLVTLLQVAKVLELFCEDRSAATLCAKEGIISIIDQMMETASQMKVAQTNRRRQRRKLQRQQNEETKDETSLEQSEMDQILVVGTRCLVKLCSHGISEPLAQILELCTHALEPGISLTKVRACCKSMAYFTESKSQKLRRLFFQQTHLKEAMWSLSLLEDDAIVNERICRLLSSISKEEHIPQCRDLFASNLYRQVLAHAKERACTSTAKACLLNATVRLKMMNWSGGSPLKKVMVFRDASFLNSNR